jgi:SAM-dependent methyltransferase
MMHCGACDFLFAFPYVAGDEAFYSILHEQSGYPTSRWEYRVVANYLAANNAIKRVLDVGAGSGAFLSLIGSGFTRFATESTATNRRLLERKGIGTFATFRDFQMRGGDRADIVTMFQVIEHIADARPFLEETRDCLKPGGIVAISTPDAPSQMRKQSLVPEFDVPPNHVSIYSAQSLHALLKQSGFNPEISLNEPPGLDSFKSALVYRLRSRSRQAKASLAKVCSNISNQRLRHIALTGSVLFDVPWLAFNWRLASLSSNLLVVAKRSP